MIAAFFGGVLQRFGVPLLAGLAILAAAAALLMGARNAGRQAERVEQLKRNLEVKNEQIRAANARPRDRRELGDRMRSGRF